MPVWYWLPGLLGRSPSYYVDPWASRTYDPRFYIFCMPEPDSDSPHVHCLFFFFVPAQSAVLSLCESEFNRISTKGCVGPVNSPAAASVYSLPKGLLFYLAQVRSFGYWTGDNLYRSSTSSGAPVSNDF